MYRCVCSELACSERLDYLPADDFLLDVSPTKWFSYTLMLRYDTAMDYQHITFSGFHKATTAMYSLTGSPLGFASKSEWICAWWLWNERRIMDWDDAFTCSDCKDKPDSETVWIVDAKADLGIKTARLHVAATAVDAKAAVIPCLYALRLIHVMHRA